MITKEEALLKIEEFLSLYKRHLQEGKFENQKEANTEEYIKDLLERLGWDRYDLERQHNVKEGRVDFSVNIENQPYFFIEVKKFGVDNLDQHRKQAIDYAFQAGVKWVILTNLKEIRVYNAQYRDSSEEIMRLFLPIKIENILDRFNDLWILSKDGAKENLIEKIAIERSKVKIKEPITILSEALIEWRSLLTKEMKAHPRLNEISHKNKESADEWVDEAVQMLLNRFIFLRVIEDLGAWNFSLKNKLNEWEEKKDKPLIEYVSSFFRDADKKYNAGLFAKHPCEDLVISDLVLKEVLLNLYTNQKNDLEWDFGALASDQDILGLAYEQYLGTTLTEKTSRAKEDKKKRKKMGIYYTPKYIVSFIVKNTLGVRLKQCKTLEEILKIRVLDPACGSGSFLKEAYRAFKNEIKLRGLDKETRLETVYDTVLKKCIYGVDLDKKACEMAKLNLLIMAAEGGTHLLPNIDESIQQGNSLIDDSIIGRKLAFKWNEKFNNIIQFDKNGNLEEGYGFDIVIGNPPWVSLKGKQKSLDLSEKELNYLFTKYPCDRYRPNLFEMFIWRGLSLIKDGGYFSFIVPDRLCYNGQFADLREYILKNFILKKMWFKPLFEGVISDNIIFVVKKDKPDKKSFVEVAEYPSIEFKKMPQDVYRNLSDCSWFIVDEKLLNLFERIKQKSGVFELGRKFQTNVGFIAKPNKVTQNIQNNKQIKVFKGENILRFETKKNYYFEFKKENLAGGTQDIKKLSKKNKVFLRKTGIDIIASFDNSGTYPEQSVYFVYTNEDKSEAELKFLCALLNSKLLNCFYRNFAVTNRDATPQLKKVDLDKFPIILPKDLKPITDLVNKIIVSDRRDEIKKIEKEIDELVYKLYGITEEEKKIIEGSLK